MSEEGWATVRMKKTVLITGASRGLGAALASEFIAKGYRLILNSTSPIKRLDPSYRIVTGDLKDEGHTIMALVDAMNHWAIDVLINNAAIYDKDAFLNKSMDDLRAMLETNLVAPANLIRRAWHLLKAKKGLIININSLAGKQGSDGEAIYCASKFGLRGLSDSLQIEASKDGIGILDVYIGAMKTDMTKHRPDWDKLIEPREVASLIHQLTVSYKFMRVSEIVIKRKVY